MKYKIKNTGKTQRVIEFHISKELTAGELDKIYGEIAREATLPGFRIGKAPIELVRKRYKKEAEEEAMKSLLNDSFKKAVRESNIEMLGLPEISDVDFDEETGMTYKATINVRPEIKIKNYKGLSLRKRTKEVKESDIDAEINALREMNAKFATKEKEAAAGDYTVCDVECKVEDKAVEKKENVWLYVGDESFIPKKHLEGLKANDEKDVDKELPKDYSKKEIAGKTANFHIKVKEIKEKILPELNDDFLAVLGDYRSVSELRETIRQAIKRKNEIDQRRELENQALKLLNDASAFEAPQFMVDRHYELLVNEAKKRFKNDELTSSELKSMEENFRERLKAEALREVRAYFILDEIAKLENTTVDEKEIEDALGAIASSSGRSAEEIKGHYDKNNLTEDLREDLRQRKVLDFIIKNANIIEEN